MFSPNGDNYLDTVELRRGLHRARRRAGLHPRRWRGHRDDPRRCPLSGDAATVTWDGTTTSGAAAPDGTYTVSLAVRDLAGNSSSDRAAAGRPRPHARARDRLTAGLLPAGRRQPLPDHGARIPPDGPATVNWTVVNASGIVVRTIKTSELLAAGSYAFTWDGRNDAGAYVPRGTYRSQVVAVDPVTTQTQTVAVVADAFRIVVVRHDARPTSRGSRSRRPRPRRSGPCRGSPSPSPGSPAGVRR